MDKKILDHQALPSGSVPTAVQVDALVGSEECAHVADAPLSDRELLEFAAKAAGMVDAKWSRLDDGICFNFTQDEDGQNYNFWNPLTDDGDALRLAVKIGASVYAPEKTVTGLWVNVLVGYGYGDPDVSIAVDGDDALAATRLAIVNAAALVGRGAPTVNARRAR